MEVDGPLLDSTPKRVLLVDLDDTLWNWFETWHASFSALVEAAIALTGIERSTLLAEIRTIHQRYGTSEYAFVIQEVPSILAAYGGDLDVLLLELDPAVHAYRSARKSTLRLYPDVETTLRVLHDQGVRILAYSDSLQYYCAWRLNRLGLDGLIDVLYCPPDHEFPESAPVPSGGASKLLDQTILRSTPSGLHKPQAEILLEILATEKCDRNQALYVGDSGANDIAMANAAGVPSVLASYKKVPEAAYKLLQAVSHWPEDKVAAERTLDVEAVPTFEARHSFGEIVSFVKFAKG